MKWVTTETVNVKLLVPSALTVAAAVGGAVGYAVASKMLEKKFREIADAEIQEAKIYYQGMYSRPVIEVEKVEKVEKPEPEYDAETDIADILETEGFLDLDSEDKRRIISDAVKAARSYQPTEERSDTSPVPTIVNVFTNPTPPGEEVLLALLADRDPSKPYIITKSEFYENEGDLEQKQFTYWESDGGVLVDDQDEYDPVDNEKVAGEDNLLRFGYGSGDERTLYIRNESIGMDLCIVKSPGSYTDEIMGISEDDGPHLKHSQIRRFRDRDE